MKHYIRKFVVAAAMTLAVSGVAQAKDDDENGKPCSEATLRGLYVFNPSGFNIIGGMAQPKAILELFSFDGAGAFTVPVNTNSLNGTINRAVGLKGTYMVEADCTGSLVFVGTPTFTFDLIVAFKGSQVYLIQTAGPVPPVFQGTAERVSR